MKKIIILPFLLLYSFFILGQERLFLGVKGGLNYSKNVLLNNQDNYNENNKFLLAFHGGLFTEIKLARNFWLSPEFTFSSKGYLSKERPGSNSSPRGDAKVHLNYLSLPLMLSYKIGSFKVVLGPEFSYLLSAKSKFDSKTIDVSQYWDNKYDFGLAAGIGFDLTEKIQTEIRYTHGFSSVIKGIQYTDEFGEPLGTKKPQFQNRCFQLSLGYRLFSK